MTNTQRCKYCFHCVLKIAVAENPLETKLTGGGVQRIKCRMGRWRDAEGGEIVLDNLDKVLCNDKLDAVYGEQCPFFEGEDETDFTVNSKKG
jgi:hypothetical protein